MAGPYREHHSNDTLNLLITATQQQKSKQKNPFRRAVDLVTGSPSKQLSDAQHAIQRALATGDQEHINQAQIQISKTTNLEALKRIEASLENGLLRSQRDQAQVISQRGRSSSPQTQPHLGLDSPRWRMPPPSGEARPSQQESGPIRFSDAIDRVRGKTQLPPPPLQLEPSHFRPYLQDSLDSPTSQASPSVERTPRSSIPESASPKTSPKKSVSFRPGPDDVKPGTVDSQATLSPSVERTPARTETQQESSYVRVPQSFARDSETPEQSTRQHGVKITRYETPALVRHKWDLHEDRDDKQPGRYNKHLEILVQKHSATGLYETGIPQQISDNHVSQPKVVTYTQQVKGKKHKIDRSAPRPIGEILQSTRPDDIMLKARLLEALKCKNVQDIPSAIEKKARKENVSLSHQRETGEIPRGRGGR